MHNLDLKLFNILFNLSGHAPWSDFLIVTVAEYIPNIIIVAVISLVIISWYKKQKQNALGYALALTSAGIARLFAGVIRYFYHHPRPPAALHILSLFPETSYSFPSGHAIFFFALATGVYFVNKRYGRGLLIFSVFMGIARIAAGVHWPSDIAAGAILGVLIAIVIHRIFREYQSMRV